VRPSDEDLVARHLRGDPEGFAELVARYTSRLFHLIYRFTGDRALAEDFTQESFLRAYASLPRSQFERPFRPWLFQIGVNLCRDWARRRVHQPLPFTDMQDETEGNVSLIESLPGDEPSPMDQVETREMGEALRHAVGTLPPEDRLMLALRYDEELSYAEIGQWFRLAPATVGTHIFRAKQRLRVSLSRFRGGGEG
jgi:RNA polymerase sigma-70 factor (ECF subfamily)